VISGKFPVVAPAALMLKAVARNIGTEGPGRKNPVIVPSAARTNVNCEPPNEFEKYPTISPFSLMLVATVHLAAPTKI